MYWGKVVNLQREKGFEDDSQSRLAGIVKVPNN